MIGIVKLIIRIALNASACAVAGAISCGLVAGVKCRETPRAEMPPGISDMGNHAYKPPPRVVGHDSSMPNYPLPVHTSPPPQHFPTK